MPVLDAASSSSRSTKRPASMSMQAAQVAARRRRHAVGDAVETLGEDARDRRLAHAARAGEQVGVVQAPPRQRVGERRDDVLLPGQLRERLRPPLAGENLVSHRNLVFGADRRLGLLAVKSRETRREPARGRSVHNVRERSSRRAAKYQVDPTDKEGWRAVPPALAAESLWLLPSGPDQVHDAAMRGDPPLIGARLCVKGQLSTIAPVAASRDWRRRPCASWVEDRGVAIIGGIASPWDRPDIDL